ncbi:hypothetical protein FG386_001966 [Cryptosporidium ryanae]|uniref:uncharacterized protein n=1 Tax=Cryptosporidium ryanae TaxID=515981 RepID=UPI00351A49B5|nr:hypothetical protein FG386_001966 [Cryptosporidium ryanae]
MSLFQPSNQIKLTNVAVVRYKSHGKRFEVACYKNKILNWRSGVEWDLDEVLQIRSIFTNVSKGLVASAEDVALAFGSTDVDKICRVILNKGEIQVSETERVYMLEKKYTDICNMISQMVVNPKNNLPLSAKNIELELRESGFSVSLNKSTKEQSLRALELLKKRIPDQIERIKMMIKITTETDEKELIMKKLTEFNISPISMEEGPQFSVTFLCDPKHYREIEKLKCKVLLLDSNIKNSEREGNNNRFMGKNTNHYKGEVVANREQELRSAGDEPSSKINCSGIEDTDMKDIEKRILSKPTLEADKNKSKSGSKSCHKCKMEFDDLGSFKQHFRSEWHIFNTKRITRKMEPVSEEEFLELQSDIKMGFLAVE